MQIPFVRRTWQWRLLAWKGVTTSGRTSASRLVGARGCRSCEWARITSFCKIPMSFEWRSGHTWTAQVLRDVKRECRQHPKRSGPQTLSLEKTCPPAARPSKQSAAGRHLENVKDWQMQIHYQAGCAKCCSSLEGFSGPLL